MQAGISELNGSQRLAPVYPLFPRRNSESNLSPKRSSLRQFCELQVEQLWHQLPGSFLQLVYHCSETQKRSTLLYGIETWSQLDPETQAFLDTQIAWQSYGSEIRIREVLSTEEKTLYCCLLGPTNSIDYLLIGTLTPLSVEQKYLIEMAMQLLSHHLETVRALHLSTQSQQQLAQIIRQAEHQIRTPIALSQIYAELLNQNIEAPELRSHVNHLQNSIKEIKLHLDQLLQTQSENSAPLQLEYHDLKEIVLESVNGLKPWLVQKQLTLQPCENSVLLKVDAWKLKQVFDNLILNAIHFSPKGGKIGCSWQTFNHEILIEVWDEGSGLSAADLRQVFTPFYSRRPGGTGLGLAIAQQIVQAHEGRLWADNLLVRGAKFSFTLPRCYSKKHS
jgi:signal transduction histidine kinase